MAVLVLIWVATLVFAGVAGHFRVPYGVAMAVTLAVLAILLYGSGRLQRRFASLAIREGIDTVDFPVERLKRELTPEAQRRREAELLAASEIGESWVCAGCGEPTPVDSSVCATCGRLRVGL